MGSCCAARLVYSRLNALSLDPLDPAELFPLPAREDASCSLREGAETRYALCEVVAQVVSRHRLCSTLTHSNDAVLP